MNSNIDGMFSDVTRLCQTNFHLLVSPFGGVDAYLNAIKPDFNAGGWGSDLQRQLLNTPGRWSSAAIRNSERWPGYRAAGLAEGNAAQRLESRFLNSEVLAERRAAQIRLSLQKAGQPVE